MGECIEIAFAANGAFFDGLLVTAVSAVRFAKPETLIAVSILDGGISKSDFRLLKEKLEYYHSNIIIRRFSVDEGLFTHLPPWAGNYMAYARFLLPQFLPEANHCIYSDVDYIWLRDIEELWNERDDLIPLQSTIDGNLGTSRKEAEWFSRHNLPYAADQYICSGLLLLNLKLFREEKALNKLEEFLLKYPDVQFPDQAALNVVFRNRIRFLAQTWQRFSNVVTNEELKMPIAIHYAGEAPWRIGRWYVGLNDSRLFWFKVLAFILDTSLVNALCRHYNSMLHAIIRRVVFWVSSSNFTKYVFYRLLIICGRKSLCKFYDVWSRRVDFSGPSRIFCKLR